MGEFPSAVGSRAAGDIGQIAIGGPAGEPKALVKAACPELACRPAPGALTCPERRSIWWPLAGIALVAALVAACGASPLSHPVASSAGQRSESASGHRAGSAPASPSMSASPGPSSSGRVKPVPRHSSSSAATEPVPNLAGDTLVQARSALSTAGFSRYSWAYSCYGSPNLNEVVRQDPAAGAQAALSTSVQVDLQASSCPTPVPNVIGMDQANAVSALEQAGFHIHWAYECLGSSDIGAVISQSPVAGASYLRGDTVDIDLQSSNCPTPVPNVIGLGKAAAISTLEQAGFRVYWAYECLSSSDIGAVINQSPVAGTSYPRGDTVTIDLQASNCSSATEP